ncbi:MAG: ABC transporter permease [Puia sp.]|nr:ABC transporter permease [Puia sp.]
MANFPLKIIFRHLWKSRLYSSINVIGLSIGIACAMLAVLYWKDERSFDDFHKNGPYLYRVTTSLVEGKGEKIRKTGGTGQVQGPAFKAAIPELLDVTRVMGGNLTGDVIGNDKALHLQMLFADANFFNTFSFHLLRGDPHTVLADAGSAVITESTAMKYFNTLDVIGRRLELNADPSARQLGRPMLITGVVRDPPANSSIRFDAVFPLQFMQLSFQDDSWLNAYLGTFVLIRPGADLKAVVKKMDAVYALHAKEQLAANWKSYGFDPRVSYGLQVMSDIHLEPFAKSGAENNAAEEDGVSNGSSPVYSWLFMGIAVFILLMAAINFVNISIADSLKRAREVGVRKIAGGSRWRIIRLFLGESAVLCLLAFALAALLANGAIPDFNRLTGRELSLWGHFDGSLFFCFSGLLATIILLAGYYPASVLSNFKPTEVLYGRQRLMGRGGFGRVLTVVQFSLAVFLLIATLVYYRQMDYIRTKDLGYNPGQVLVTSIQADGDIKILNDQFRNELAKEPSIEIASFGGDRAGSSEVRVHASGGNNQADGGDQPGRKESTDRTVLAVHKVIDENYLQLMQIPLKAGRDLSAAFPADKRNSVIVNETFVRAAGLEDPIGAQVQIDRYFNKGTATIIGVVKDFHTGSLRETIQPVVLFMSDWFGGSIRVKFEKPRQQEAIAALQNAYRKILPRAVYHYDFLDELNAKEYTREAHWQQVIRFATVLSILICSLGLFGLAHLSTRQRIKEIGIRKVLGASAGQITGLLAGNFLRLVIIAYIIAAPVAWMVMSRWLADFAYRVPMNAGIFILAGAIAAAIAFISVSVQSILAAIANPVDSLRTD